MKQTIESIKNNANREVVLTKAVINASNLLGLNNQQLSNTIDVSPQYLAEMKIGQSQLKDGSNSFRLAALLVRVFCAIDAIAGGDVTVVKKWMKSRNTKLNASPIEIIGEKEGLENVVSYLNSRLASL